MKQSAINIFILVLVCTFGAIAGDDVVRIIEITPSSRVLRFNIGKGELKPSDSGLLVAVIKQSSPYTKLKKRYLPIAKAFLVKAALRNSIWMLRDISKTNKIAKTRKLLKVGSKYLLLLKRDLLRGRRKRLTSKLDIISPSNRSIDDEEILFEDSNKQLDAFTLRLKKWMKNETHQEIHLAKWVKDDANNDWKDDNRTHWSPTSTVRSDSTQKLSKISELSLYEKSLVTYLKRLNDPNVSWDKKIEAEKNYLNEAQGLSANVTRKERELIAKQRQIKGLDWSDSYSQEELRSWVEEYGSVTEIGVRESIDRYSLVGSFHGSFGLNLANNELASDFQNTRKFRASIEGSVEWYLFRSLETYLRNFSLEFSARVALDAVATGAANALSRETSAAVRMLWYPTGPQRMEKNILFFGPVLRLGFSNLEVNRTSETGKYNLIGAGIVAGYRYNFKSGFGARVLFSLEQLALQSSQRSEPNIHLESRITLSDFRLQIGLSYVF